MERREISPNLKAVYLETLKEAVSEFYNLEDPGDIPERGSMAWFDKLENFNKTEKLATLFGIPFRDTISAIISSIPHGQKKLYFASYLDFLSQEDIEEIKARFGWTTL
jgi:hypothetical protein